MAEQHPIIPPPELVQQLYEMPRIKAIEEAFRAGADQQLKFDAEQIAQAYQAGADQELEACCEYLVRCAQWEPEDVNELRAARRPKPPSLKEQALETLQRLSKDKYPCNYQEDSDWDTLRRALESIND